MSASEFVGWLCAHCGSENETEIDLSAGHHQEFVEDCVTCCHPNLLVIDIDPKTQEIILDARGENV